MRKSLSALLKCESAKVRKCESAKVRKCESAKVRIVKLGCIIVIRVCQRRALCNRRAGWDIPSIEDSAQ